MALAITTTSISVPRSGAHYPLGVSGQTGTGIEWEITAGMLPRGLQLNGPNIVGLSSAPGAATVTMRATDVNASGPIAFAEAQVTVTVS